MDDSVCLTKIKYPTKPEAMKVSKRMASRSGAAFVYRCKTCGEFHITSQPQDVHTKVAERRRARRRK